VAEKTRAKTLFATHYHELTELEGRLSGVRNFNVAVKKRGNDIIFLHKIIPGGADDSYGVEVARLAGLPNPVIERARILLRELESSGGNGAVKNGALMAARPAADQMSLETLRGQDIIDDLLTLDVNTLTPIEALQTLYKLQAKAKGV
jgi:DNA mismatch repair protein MutS